MNQQERKYAMERVDSIVKAKYFARKEPKLPSLSWKEKLALVNKGAVKVVDGLRCHTNFDDAFVWPEPTAAVKAKYEKDHDAYRQWRYELTATAVRIKDEIMLGDNAEALKLLRDFEASK